MSSLLPITVKGSVVLNETLYLNVKVFKPKTKSVSVLIRFVIKAVIWVLVDFFKTSMTVLCSMLHSELKCKTRLI